MKKFLLLLLLLTAGCRSTEKTKAEAGGIPPLHFAGQLDQGKIAFLKDNYPRPEGSALVINYKQPNSSCHFNFRKKERDSTAWWRKSYSRTPLKNSAAIYVISESHYVPGLLDNLSYFADKNDFLLKNFFDRLHSCYGVLVLNETGSYLQYNGTLSQGQVSKYVEALISGADKKEDLSSP